MNNFILSRATVSMLLAGRALAGLTGTLPKCWRDAMFMSLVNHRYLATKPNDHGRVTVSADGPRPDRKGELIFSNIP